LNIALFFTAFFLSATLTGCGQSGTSPVDAGESNKLCGAIKDTGLTKQCSASNLSDTVGIVIDTNDEAARNLCIDIAGKIKPLTVNFTGSWKLQIFSPYRNDKPLAYCALH
jgi:hypothetical protein